MPTVRITAKTIENLKPPSVGRLELWDSLLPGFGVRVTDKGARSWFVMYRSPTERDDRGNPRQRRLTLGNAKILELADARKAARQALDQVERGVDPSPEKITPASIASEDAAAKKAAEEKAKRTFRAVAERFKKYQIELSLKPGKSRNEATRIVDKLAARWGDKLLTEIDEADINDYINEIEARGAAVMAKNTRRQIKTMFAWCQEQGLLKVNGVRVAPPTDFIRKAPKVFSRERTLSPDEVRVAMQAYAKMGGIYAQVFRLMALTAQRENEVAGMRWTELEGLDGDNPVWRIPGARTKNGKEHLVHLSPQAIAVITERSGVRFVDDKGNKTPFVFPGRDKPMTQHITSFSKPADRVWEKIAAIKADAEEDEHVFAHRFTPHDWRRTFASLANEELRLRREVTDKVLNHTTRGVAGIYDRAQFLDERKTALLVWGNYVEGLTKRRPANVADLEAEKKARSA